MARSFPFFGAGAKHFLPCHIAFSTQQQRQVAVGVAGGVAGGVAAAVAGKNSLRCIFFGLVLVLKVEKR